MTDGIRRVSAGWLLLLCLGGCEQLEIGFAPNARFSAFEVPESPRAAACLDELARADAQVIPASADATLLMGSMSERAFRQQERRRQRSWDQQYCRRQADCLTLAEPQTSAYEIGEVLDGCLRDRAHRRVSMAL